MAIEILFDQWQVDDHTRSYRSQPRSSAHNREIAQELNLRDLALRDLSSPSLAQSPHRSTMHPELERQICLLLFLLAIERPVRRPRIRASLAKSGAQTPSSLSAFVLQHRLSSWIKPSRITWRAQCQKRKLQSAGMEPRG